MSVWGSAICLVRGVTATTVLGSRGLDWPPWLTPRLTFRGTEAQKREVNGALVHDWQSPWCPPNQFSCSPVVSNILFFCCSD